MRLLFVCLGNICRSPTAEGTMRALVEEAGLGRQVQLDSAGTGGWHVGEPPDRRGGAPAPRPRGGRRRGARAGPCPHVADFPLVLFPPPPATRPALPH